MHEVDDALTHGERLLLRAIRLLALRSDCPGLRAQFGAACGCSGEPALRALEAFLQQLAMRGRRRITLALPTDPRPTGDETLLLDVFACAQAEAYGALDQRLAALTGGRPPRAMGAAACWVAEAFELNGLTIPVRLDVFSPCLMAAE